MDVKFAFLCDSAVQAERGKTDALGIGIESIHGTLPVKVLQLVFVARLRFELDECDKTHEFLVALLNPDGDEIHSFKISKSVSKPDVGSYGQFSIRASFQILTFTKHGPHAVRLEHNGSEELSLDFEVGPPPP